MPIRQLMARFYSSRAKNCAELQGFEISRNIEMTVDASIRDAEINVRFCLFIGNDSDDSAEKHRNASTMLIITEKSPMISTAAPFFLRFSKDERRVFQQNQMID
jgi:hypothetical protein